ncbi:MAG: hypothetical protein WC777_04040 [Candidatus Gracilibacteria bacterium]|jgi:hypothetical protein
MQKTCKNCSQAFEIMEEDRAFYSRIDVPEPTWCPPCREMRRMAWCNEGILYNRKCDLTGKAIVSEFSPKNPRKVYSVQAWWGDDWDPLTYGKDFDFNRPFFDQFRELELVVPHQCVQIESGDINSEYTHQAGQNKNCYFIFHATFAEDCYYGYGVKKSKDCVDTHYCHGSELCYECVDVKDSNDLAWCQDCTGCSSSSFLRDCVGCMDCFMCVGLRNKKYCFLNEQLSEEAYKNLIKDLNTGSHQEVQKYLTKFKELQAKHPFRYLQNTMVENCLGDYLYKSKNAQFCFDCSDIEDCKYLSQIQLHAKDSYDIYQFGINMELCYESAMVGANVTNVRFSHIAVGQVSNLTYCMHCHRSSENFGCFGLKRNKFCILNKQYSEEDYFKLKTKIIEYMKQTGEWGEFFPIKNSPYGYNETTAQLFYPTTKDQAQAKGFNWEDDLPGTYGKETLTQVPDKIQDVTDSIVEEILACEYCKKNYKITAHELNYYRKKNIPLPRACFNCRRLNRHGMRNPRKFWLRNCMNAGCTQSFHSTISPDRPEIVFCESCYLQSVY